MIDKKRKSSSQSPLRILVVEDDPLFQQALRDMLEKRKYKVEVASTIEETLEGVPSFRPHLILMDINLPDGSGVDLLEKVKGDHPDLPVIMISAVDRISTVVECTRRGAYDYLTKPVDKDELFHRLEKALEAYDLKGKVKRTRILQRSHQENVQLVGKSPAMDEIRQHIKRMGPTDANVLIMGETGTGKEMVAQAFHYRSLRADGPFVAVNCGAIPGELIESEFFGHVKGAFTSARDDRLGKFQLAHEGTLFLDEIGELPKEAQVKLLRVLEDQVFYPVGSHDQVEVDVRLVAATNVDLEEKTAAGEFREDLFYRLNVFSLTIPPLRERVEDIPALARHFLKKFQSKFGKTFTEITDAAERILLQHGWKGNIRELRNAMERVVLYEKGPKIKGEHLHFLSPTLAAPSPKLELFPEGLDPTLEKVEKRLIEEALEKCDGNKTRTAKMLHISLPALYYRLEKHEIQ